LERISPTTDLAFKKVLGSEENKDILAGFIKDFFEVEAEDIVIEKPYSITACKESMSLTEISRLRETLKDVAASFRTADFISELQVKKTSYYEERSLYYPLDRFVQNYNRVGEMKTDASGRLIRYSSLRPVYSMNILGYDLFDDDKDALRIFELYDPKRSKSFIKRLLRIGYFELKKENIETVNQKHWRDYFNTGAVSCGAPVYIKKASKIIEYINLTEGERSMISTLERLEANEHAQLVYHENKGRAEGEIIGEAKGRAEGRAETEKKAYEEKLESVKNFIEMGLTTEQISRAMKISEKEIENLRM
jgi:predicted transposase/invertase (TIGR01784 family)